MATTKRSRPDPKDSEPAPFRPPTKAQVKFLMAPSRAYFRPQFFGLEHVDPKRPALLVGNHTLIGVLDAPLFVAQIYEERGVWVRALGDRFHFAVPGWRDMMKRIGVVVGSPQTCSALMRAGEHVLVFPGGGREVAKRKGEAYELIWKERVGFARMAIEHGYPILPFAAVGAEECFDIVWDADDVLESSVGGILKKTPLYDAMRGGDALMPFVRGWKGTPLPKPERFYFAVGEPIPTESFGRDPNGIEALRDLTRERVEALIADLLARRREDSKPGKRRRPRSAP